MLDTSSRCTHAWSLSLLTALLSTQAKDSCQPLGCGMKPARHTTCAHETCLCPANAGLRVELHAGSRVTQKLESVTDVQLSSRPHPGSLRDV